MIIIFALQIGLCFTYLCLIGWVSNNWDKSEETTIPKSYTPKGKYSIIIPFKDEAGNLGKCVNSLLQLSTGPEHEIICIDDGSLDNGKHEVEHLPVKLLLAQGKGKKSAISQGIQNSKNDWIITVDADCVFHKEWLKIIDSKIQIEEPDVIVGPVKMENEGGVLARFQTLDTVATMGTTAAGIKSDTFHLCNGANFIYKKGCFNTVNGFDGNEHIASGDDVFLLKKFSEESTFNISFLKSNRAAVITKSETSWSALYRQRKRWATKSTAYANKYILGIQGLVFLMSALIFLDFTLLPILFGEPFIIIGMFVILIKGIIDFLYLNKMASFYKSKNALKAFIPAFILFIIYYLIMGLQALFPSTVKWKGRKI